MWPIGRICDIYALGSITTVHNPCFVHIAIFPTDTFFHRTQECLIKESSLINYNKDYLEEQLEISNSIKKWKILKDLINKTDCHKSSTSEIFINGSICNDLQTIVNAHNEYFVEVGPRLANNIFSSINPMSYLTNHVDNSMYMPEITECEVITVICSLTNSSPGWEYIPAKLLKPYIEEYIKPLTYIINKAFETGVFQDSLKLAKVIPIYKSGDKTLLSNYRPISILNSFSKNFEKVIYQARVQEFVRGGAQNLKAFFFFLLFNFSGGGPAQK